MNRRLVEIGLDELGMARGAARIVAGGSDLAQQHDDAERQSGYRQPAFGESGHVCSSFPAVLIAYTFIAGS